MAAVNFHPGFNFSKTPPGSAFASLLCLACQQSVSVVLYMSSSPGAETSEFKRIFLHQSNNNKRIMLHHERGLSVFSTNEGPGCILQRECRAVLFHRLSLTHDVSRVVVQYGTYSTHTALLCVRVCSLTVQSATSAMRTRSAETAGLAGAGPSISVCLAKWAINPAP